MICGNGRTKILKKRWNSTEGEESACLCHVSSTRIVWRTNNRRQNYTGDAVFFYDENEWNDRREEKKDVSTCTMMYIFVRLPFLLLLFSSTFRLRSVYIRQIRRLLLLLAEAKGNKLNTFLEDSDRRHNSVRFFHNVQISLPIVDIILLFVLAFPHIFLALLFFLLSFHYGIALHDRLRWSRVSEIHNRTQSSRHLILISSVVTWMNARWSRDARGLCSPDTTFPLHPLHALLAFSHCKILVCILLLCCRVRSSSWGARGIALYVKCDKENFLISNAKHSKESIAIRHMPSQD